MAKKLGSIAGMGVAPAMEPECWIAGYQRASAVTVNGGVLVAKSGLTTR